MEPYVIICNSCAARLKVTNKALIGQRLACPKCQSMIDVVAPVGFEPTPEPPKDESNSEQPLSSNFEDIESLLAGAQTLGRGKSTPAGPINSSKLQSPPPASAPQTPMMPEAQWTTESNKRKKRILQIVMLTLVTLATLGIGIWALIGAANSVDTTVASNDESLPQIVQGDAVSTPDAGVPETSNYETSNSETSNSESLNPETLISADSSPKDSPPAGSDRDAESEIEDVPETELPAPPVKSKVNSGEMPVSPATLPPPPRVDNSAGESAPPPLQSDFLNSRRAETENPLATQNPPATDSPSPLDPDSSDSPLIASTENSLGTLSKILKGQGTSLKQIEDIAEIQRERALIGTPTYLIEPPDKKPLQLDRQLSAELSGWKLDNVPLIDAISDLEMLSDIPVSIDPSLIREGSIDLQRTISLKIESLTFKSAFETLLIDDGLVLNRTSSGIQITTPPGSEVITKSYPQSFSTDAVSTGRLRELIITVTGINDWDDENYKLDISTDSVTVSHLQKNQKMISDLLAKLNAAAAYQSDAVAMKDVLRPLALKAKRALAASPNLTSINPYRRSMRIGSLLRIVRNATKLTTIIDWENLTKQGWFPNTRMPGRIDEPTNQALMNQLGHAMEVTTIVIGSDTIMLTTFENAGKQSDIEVYSVGDVIDNRMTPSQLDTLMTETLGVDQLTPPNAIVIYFAECKCLVANAPQIIQRQISSIVKEL